MYQVSASACCLQRLAPALKNVTCPVHSGVVKVTKRDYHGHQAVASSADTYVVDMRSDTLTQPSPKMRQAMAQAEVGDDVFGEDPTVNALQIRCAKLFGMEASLFVPSGTMGNLISVMAHCNERGQEVLLGHKSHIHLFEQGGIAQLGGVHPRTVMNLPDGTFDLAEAEEYIRSLTDPHEPLTRLICVENTHNVSGGKVIPLDFLKRLRALADRHSLAVHMDGARMMNAAVALDVSPDVILQYVHSVSVCLSKGVGAPVGSIIGGTQEFIARCRRLRKVLGGGMRQSGVLAAAALVALDDVIPRLQTDHQRATKIAQAINTHGQGVASVDLRDKLTNIIMVDIHKQGLTAEQFCQRMQEVSEEEMAETKENLVVSGGPFSEKRARFVTNCNHTDEEISKALQKFEYVLKKYV